jgi:mannose-6-phosphate isomerase
VEKPLRLTPSLRPKVWGKTSLAPWFADPEEPIGEAWYLAEQELPLLVKLIFTSERLSVQVHPADGECGPRGKSEMWHILDAEPGAAIALGFREPITRERLREAARTGEIERLLNWIPVRPGETYYTPAHTVHAIGAGLVLCEIQQHCDVTYRLWDYGRPRELHLEQAAAISDLGVHPGATQPRPVGSGRDVLVSSPHFVTESIRLNAGEEVSATPEECQLWICLEGAGAIGGEPVRAGEVWMLPSSTGTKVKAETGMRFLRSYVPG